MKSLIKRELMQFQFNAPILFFVCFLTVSNSFAQQNGSYICSFKNVIGAQWSNGDWVSSKFLPKSNFFTIKIENSNVNVQSISEHFGGWGGMNTSCTFVDSVGYESKHYRCMQTSVSSKLLVFNPTTKNGALISSDGVLYPDNWKLKDEIGIEVFKCN